MWGRHVENELHQAQRKAKNEAQALSKMQMVMKRLMFPPEEEAKEEKAEDKPTPIARGQFRDPASMFAKE